MNMPYEMFLTIQLVHLTCRKDHVQSPIRKEGWNLFRRTSDDSSRFTPISIHEDEPEASIAEEKDIQKNIMRTVDEYHLKNEKSFKMKIVWQYFQTKKEGHVWVPMG